MEAGNNNSYGINITNNGSVTVENGTYTGATTAIQVQEGSLTILGGTFEQLKRLLNRRLVMPSMSSTASTPILKTAPPAFM